MSKIKNEVGIIVALDMDDIDDTFELIDHIEAAKGNFVLKVGCPLEMKYGIDLISDICEICHLPIIYDGKIADIPYISAKIAESAYNAGADAVIVHGFVGADVVEAVADLGMGDVIVVGAMSHPGFPLSHTGFKHPANLWDIVATVNEMADGIVLPATRPEVIREVVGMLDPDVYIIAPGVGAQGAKVGDAFAVGATYEIVGRKIYEDRNPRAMAEYCYGCGIYYEREH